jgi:hypothetical protein
MDLETTNNVTVSHYTVEEIKEPITRLTLMPMKDGNFQLSLGTEKRVFEVVIRKKDFKDIANVFKQFRKERKKMKAKKVKKDEWEATGMGWDRGDQ